MKKNIFLWILLLLISMFQFWNVFASDFTTLRDIDKGTFNEYRYYMVREYFRLKENFELKGTIAKDIADNILSHAKVWFNYLPDSLMNNNYYNDLKIAVERGIASPRSEVYYEDIIQKLDVYIQKVSIQQLTGSIEASPITGNAPLTVTFRGRVTDPSGTVIPSSNYIWWFDNGWIKKVVGRGQSINYTFKEEGNFSIFLDVKSNHKNAGGYTDILPFSTRSVVEVKEKVASLIININSVSLKESDEIKFTPEEANYGLIFDATSSTPTGWAKFRRTEWNFGNGVERKYDGWPKIERVIYSKEWNYPVSLRFITNEWKTIERNFVIAIHKPIATIQANKDDGYIGDKFTFSARSSVNEKNLSYTWNIIDISNDKILSTKNGSTFNHTFSEKGRYNLQLQIKDAAGNQDTDTKIIYINSRAPVADFSYTIPDKAKPNRVLLDGTKSYDPDFSDDGKLKYIWTINGEKVEIEALDSKWAIWYYTFESVGDHSVVLEVMDPDDMNAIKQQKIKIQSILSVEFFPLPRVVQRSATVRFSVTAPYARYFEWDFWDGNQKQSASSKMEYQFQKSGIFNVRLTVKDADGNSNQLTKTVYVAESNSPYAAIWIDLWGTQVPSFDESACSWGAYIVDRVKPVYFKWGDSLNLDGANNGLSYTWKIGHDKYITSRDTSFKFDELGCFPVKLTVKSDKNNSTHSSETWIKVENLKPTLSSLNVSVQNEQADPVVVSVSAVWATDPDGVVQSYLWYYYTDTDTEPQDFRITSLPNTTFVIPKISGNYYFVVVMRDNNDARYSSEEWDSNKYFITLSWDNINTPLVDFKVNKNNLFIWEEAIFSAKVKNVLWQNITDKSEFAWDFDGDGFYDKETPSWEISHKFENSGTFYTKVRVKYKGMTNVRTIEMNVANMLEPNFKYISIWDTMVFFDTSSGKYDKSVWDMWDGNTIEARSNFVYTYEDGKPTHKVTLKISEGTKVKTKTQDVVKDLKEMVNARNSKEIYLLSNLKIENDTIAVEEASQKVVIYIAKQNGVENYWVDFDIEIDSDLNGTKDDDIDNEKDSSFQSAGMIEIPLNEKKLQTVRIFTLDRSGNILEGKDIKIDKNYITQEEIDVDAIVFSGISDAEKVKIEKLKTYVQWLPQEHRLKWMQYIQKLQEEWFYVNEKTKIILEFESFIDSLGVSNATEIINLLESFLIEGQEDQSLRNMAYNVVKNLIPKELVEYDEIIANLEQINENPNKAEENKVLGKEILEMIKDTSLISNEDKLTIKTQLQVFIYGSVDNIPEEIVKEVTNNSSESGNKVIGLLSSLANFIWLIVWGIIFIILWFFIWFKITNKNKNQWLQDFIIEKTSGKTEDILWDFQAKEVKKEEASITRKTATPEKISSDVLSSWNFWAQPKQEAEVPEWLKGGEPKKEDGVKQNMNTEEQTPDWLQWNTVSSQSVVSKSNKQENVSSEEQVPDWLKNTINQADEVAKNTTTWEVKTQKIDTLPEQEEVPDWLKSQSEPIQDVWEKWVSKQEIPLQEIDTSISEEQVPDWLKGSFEVKSEKNNTSEGQEKNWKKVTISDEGSWWKEIINLSQEEEKEDVPSQIQWWGSEILPEEVPDWLQWSFSQTAEIKDENNEKQIDTKIEDEEVPDWLKWVVSEEKIVSEEKEIKKTKASPKTSQTIKSSEKTTKPKKAIWKSQELWNDGMDIPNWLQDSQEKTPSSPTKKDDFWTLDDTLPTDESAKKE